MKNWQKVFREEFKTVKLSEEKNLYIKNSIVKKYENRQLRKSITLKILLFLLLSLIGFGIVYAEEIKDFITSFTIYKHEEEDFKRNEFYFSNRKNMNTDADLPELLGNGLEFETLKLESILGMEILKSDYFKSNIWTQTKTKKENGKIASAEFSILNFTNGEETIKSDSYSIWFRFRTKYDYNSNDLATVVSEQNNILNYDIESLNVESYIIYGSDYDSLDNRQVYAVFIHEDVFYRIQFNFYKKDYAERMEIVKSVLESLHI